MCTKSKFMGSAVLWDHLRVFEIISGAAIGQARHSLMLGSTHLLLLLVMIGGGESDANTANIIREKIELQENVRITPEISPSVKYC